MSGWVGSWVLARTSEDRERHGSLPSPVVTEDAALEPSTEAQMGTA